MSENSNENVLQFNGKIPPKTFKVRHKGLHGSVTYNPNTKKWHWVVSMKIPMKQEGDEPSQEKATLALKRVLDTAATTGNNVSTVD